MVILPKSVPVVFWLPVKGHETRNTKCIPERGDAIWLEVRAFMARFEVSRVEWVYNEDRREALKTVDVYLWSREESPDE